jgi:hypothetical protein
MQMDVRPELINITTDEVIRKLRLMTQHINSEATLKDKQAWIEMLKSYSEDLDTLLGDATDE